VTPTGYSTLGNFNAGTNLVGAGNGVGYAHEGGNAGLYAVTSSGYSRVTGFDAGTTMAGLGDGTALAHEGTSSLLLYFVTPTGYSTLGNFNAGTNLVGAGNGVGYAHEGGNAGLYAVTSSGYSFVTGLNAGTMLTGAGNGIGYAMEGTNLYRLTTTGYSFVDSFVSPYALCGSGDGSAFVLDASNDTLYHVGASGTGSTFVGLFADGTIMANVGVPVSEPVPVTWTGIGDTTWSTASGLNNWKDSGGAAADYANGAPVTFDDTATGTDVDISAADVLPASVTFNNSSQNFTITGAKGIAGTTGLLKQGTGKVTLNSVNTYSGVTTVEAGTLQMSESAYGNVATNGGADIQGGKGVLDYSISGVSPAPEVQAALTVGYNGGAWDLGLIRNTTAATTGLTLGWADDTTASQVTVMATYAGDADLSGATDVADLTALLNNYNQTSMVWANGDFNYDGSVNVADLTALLNNYNKSVGGSVMADLNMRSSAVPEPGTIALLAAGLLALITYAWHRRK
jgi:autotransporter-associated beta strand protein